MTISQVFRWFCKEQKIMHLIQEMYYKIQPLKRNIVNGVFKNEYMTFDEYVESKFSYYGFNYIFQSILDDYRCSLTKNKPYYEYIDICKEFDEKYKNHIKRWDYFAKNNIELNDKVNKIGDTIYFRDWGNGIKSMKVTSVDLYGGRIYGSFRGQKCYGIYLSYLTDASGNHINLNYKIKRKRKVYYGAS